MSILTSFFLSESGFASPIRALSGSWIAGILVGAFSLLTPVVATYAHGDCASSSNCGGGYADCCCDEGDPKLTCFSNHYICECS